MFFLCTAPNVPGDICAAEEISDIAESRNDLFILVCCAMVGVVVALCILPLCPSTNTAIVPLYGGARKRLRAGGEYYAFRGSICHSDAFLDAVVVLAIVRGARWQQRNNHYLIH